MKKMIIAFLLVVLALTACSRSNQPEVGPTTEGSPAENLNNTLPTTVPGNESGQNDTRGINPDAEAPPMRLVPISYKEIGPSEIKEGYTIYNVRLAVFLDQGMNGSIAARDYCPRVTVATNEGHTYDTDAPLRKNWDIPLIPGLPSTGINVMYSHGAIEPDYWNITFAVPALLEPQLITCTKSGITIPLPEPGYEGDVTVEGNFPPVPSSITAGPITATLQSVERFPIEKSEFVYQSYTLLRLNWSFTNTDIASEQPVKFIFTVVDDSGMALWQSYGDGMTASGENKPCMRTVSHIGPALTKEVSICFIGPADLESPLYLGVLSGDELSAAYLLAE